MEFSESQLYTILYCLQENYRLEIKNQMGSQLAWELEELIHSINKHLELI